MDEKELQETEFFKTKKLAYEYFKTLAGDMDECPHCIYDHQRRTTVSQKYCKENCFESNLKKGEKGYYLDW